MRLNKIAYIIFSIRLFIVISGAGLLFFFCIQSIDTGLERGYEGVEEIPLLEAAATGDVERVKELLHNGVDVDVVDKDGNSALTFAVWNGIYPANRNVIELLLNRQANTRSRNRGGIAVVQNVVKLDDFVWRMQVIGKLIKFGAVLGDIDNKGFDLLQKNVETYATQSTAMILEWWGRLITPEMMRRAKNRALEYNLRDVLDVLNTGLQEVKHDAYWNPGIMDVRTGLSDLHCAVIMHNQKLVGEILKKGVDVNQSSNDEYGMTPLHYAVLHYDPDMVAYLIAHKVQVNKRNKTGHTPLHMIAWLVDPLVVHKIADLLIGHGALLNAQNDEGNTLLHLLVYNNDEGAINYIGKKHGWGDLSIINNDRETPAQLADRLGRKDILQRYRQ